MDDIDFQIANMLYPNGRISNREIARCLGISDKTVGKRLKRMTKNNILYVSAMINIEKFPELYVAIVGIEISTSPETVFPKISNISSVLYTMTVTGRFDLFSIIIATSKKKLNKVIMQIDAIEKVTKTETFFILENYELWIPASKLFQLKKNNTK